MGKILALLCCDTRYAQRLTEYFNETKEIMFDTAAFTDASAYEEYSSSNEVELLLCEEGLYKKNYLNTAKTVVLLSDVMAVCEAGEQERIYKFQSAQNIVQDIIQIYLRKVPGYAAVSSEAADIYTVISPSGGSWCSATAAIMAGILSEAGRTVLLSFDAFYSDANLGIITEKYGISKAVCKARLDGGERNTINSSMLGQNEYFSYLLGSTHWADFTEILPEEAEMIISDIIGLGFKYILIDAGGFYRCTSALLAASSKIFVPVHNTRSEQERMQEWIRQCRLDSYVDVSRIKQIQVPFEECIKSGMYNMEILLGSRCAGYLRTVM